MKTRKYCRKNVYVSYGKNSKNKGIFIIIHISLYRYYIIDIIHLEKELHLLRFDTQTKEEESKIPDFLQIVAEVTDDKDFSSFNIAGNKFQK